MTINKNTRFLIVGLGLLGGSYARGLTGKGYYVEAITKNQKDCDFALDHEIVKKCTTEVDEEMIRQADVIIFALYPDVFIKWIEENGELIKPGTIITDVTGVKRSIVYQIQDMLRPDVEFIPAHPMAGREVSGVENSTDKMFIGANYIVTPTEKNTPEAIETCIELGKLLGFSNVTVLSPEEHDEMIGFLSQLTHCIAITLMTCNDKENMEKFTGDSFRDLTRIARINDLMWSELFVANKDVLIEQMNLFIDKFNALKGMLEAEDIEGMRAMMRHSTKRRALFDKK